MSQNRARATLVIIALLFAAPVLIAVLMRSDWWDYRPSGTTNHGVLVQPVVSLDPGLLDFIDEPPDAPAWPGDGRWAVIFAPGGDCGDACLAVTETLRQVHRATGRHQAQIDMLLVVPGDAPELHRRLLGIYPAFRLTRDDGGHLLGMLATLGETDAPGQVFLADPAGNIMMRYAHGFEPSGLIEDLERLLKWSAQDG